MTPEDAAKILAVAATFDARLTPPSRDDALARSIAWAQALAPGITVAWAQAAVVEHYANQTTSLMPAHLNDAWRRYRRAEAEREATRAVIEAPAGVPMPEEVRQAWRALASRRESA